MEKEAETKSTRNKVMKIKRPLSPYLIFMKENRAEIKAKNNRASFGELSKIIAQIWNSMDERAKEVRL